jgi:hypothetical protein
LIFRQVSKNVSQILEIELAFQNFTLLFLAHDLLMILSFQVFSFNASQDDNIFNTDLFSLMFHPDDGCPGSQ